MIRRNNPEIDVEQLECRVRNLADRIDGEAAVRARNADPSVRAAYESERVAFVRELLADVEGRLDLASSRASRRTELPPRLRAAGPVGEVLLSGYNYLFKAQREASHEQITALRSTAVAIRAVLDLVVVTRGDLRDVERRE